MFTFALAFWQNGVAAEGKPMAIGMVRRIQASVDGLHTEIKRGLDNGNRMEQCLSHRYLP